MKNIKAHIKENRYSSMYLLYGTEDYLKKIYRNKLKAGLLGGSDEMNYTYFEGDKCDTNELTAIASTLPFFSDRRLIVVEDSGFFKKQNDIADYIPELPESTILVFVEKEVDKRSRLFKAVKTKGYICEINSMKPDDLKHFVISILSKDKKQMSEAAVQHFLKTVGSDMQTILNELEKLICYCIHTDIIGEREIDLICTEQIENKVFVMMEAIGNKKIELAMSLYYNLMALKEKPLVILYLIIRHFNKLMQIQELRQMGMSDRDLSGKAGVPPFSVSAYLRQTKNFTMDQMKEAIIYGTELEEGVKTGRIEEQIALEIMIVKSAAL